MMRIRRNKPQGVAPGTESGAGSMPAKRNGHGSHLYAPTEMYQRLGICAKLHYPSTTVGQLLDQTADRFSDAPAMAYGEVRWSYTQLREKVNRMAAGLALQGVRKGDAVLMTLPNCPEFIVSFLAISRLGAVVVNAGPLMGVVDLTKVMDMTRPRVVIGLDLQASSLARASSAHRHTRFVWVSLKCYQPMLKRLGYRIKLWQAGEGVLEEERQMGMAKLLAEAPARPPTVAPKQDDTAVLQPTGGTTGTLKVAMLSHRNLLANATQLSVWARLREGQESVLAVLPMFHVYGLMTCMFTSVMSGGLMIPLTRFRVGEVMSAIARHKPSVVPLAPAIAEAMCEALEQSPAPEVIEAMRHTLVISGAAPLRPETAERFEKLTGARIVQGYGLTEASPVTHINPLADRRLGTIGIPTPDTLARLADLNDPAADAPIGEPGELLVSGPQVFEGYYGNEQETRHVLHIDAEGRRWLRTGDVARVDPDGFFFILDRRKDMINCAGLKVYPAKVEHLLQTHHAVQDAAVVGRPDSKNGEAVTAIVVATDARHDAQALAAELKAYCRAHLAPYEVPSRFEFVDAIPRSGLGKVLRYVLRDSGGNGHDKGNGHGEHRGDATNRLAGLDQEDR